MHLISWNVAGLSTTLQRIHSDYSAEAAAAADDSTESLAMSHYLRRHGSPTIVCLQEHKISLSQLSCRSEPFHVASSLQNYESFWSCCRNPSKKGFNGVVTFAAAGTVKRASAAPLGCDQLDCEGRCVMTDHGLFSVFNVYVPNQSACNSLSFKMKFLTALRTAMRKERLQHGNKIMLVGDLNIAARSDDIHWTFRTVSIDDIIQQVDHCLKTNNTITRHSPQDKVQEKEELSSSGQILDQWKLDLHTHWDKIRTALATMQVIPVHTQNVATGVTFDKYRVRISLLGNNKDASERTIYVGGLESTSEAAMNKYNLDVQTYYDEELEQEAVTRKANTLNIGILSELMWKIAKVTWNVETQKFIVSKNEVRYHPAARWLEEQIMGEDGMIDGFRHLYPDAKARFTCWDQSTNKRFENQGTRIDYILLDKELLPFLEKSNDHLQCGKFSQEQCLCEEAALHAATASGAFQGASFGGNGIAMATRQALDTQFGPVPHTGIIYTPPSYSDHVAISILFHDDDDVMMNHPTILEQDFNTRNTQPHKSQQSISSFFGTKKRTEKSTACHDTVSRTKSFSSCAQFENVDTMRSTPTSTRLNFSSSSNAVDAIEEETTTREKRLEQDSPQIISTGSKSTNNPSPIKTTTKRKMDGKIIQQQKQQTRNGRKSSILYHFTVKK